jgi:hypothetical protein
VQWHCVLTPGQGESRSDAGDCWKIANIWEARFRVAGVYGSSTPGPAAPCVDFASLCGNSCPQVVYLQLSYVGRTVSQTAL